MYGGEATWRLIDTDDESGPVGIQIFGADPENMAAAARLVGEHHLDVLDLNFGCPAKKVVKKCGGSALLADLPLDLLEARLLGVDCNVGHDFPGCGAGSAGDRATFDLT